MKTNNKYLILLITLLFYSTIRFKYLNYLNNNEVIDFLCGLFVIIMFINIKLQDNKLIEKFNSIGENVDYEMLQYISSLVSDPNRPLTVDNLIVTNKLNVDGEAIINNADSNKGLKIKNGSHNTHMYHDSNDFVVSGNRRNTKINGMGVYPTENSHLNSSATINGLLRANGNGNSVVVNGHMEVNDNVNVSNDLSANRDINASKIYVGRLILGHHIVKLKNARVLAGQIPMRLKNYSSGEYLRRSGHRHGSVKTDNYQPGLSQWYIDFPHPNPTNN